jgi:hypothetical protein
MYFFSGLSKNRVSRRDMLKFVQKNLADLLVRFKGNFSIGRLIQYSFDQFTTDADRQSVIDFFKDKESVTHVSFSCLAFHMVANFFSFFFLVGLIVLPSINPPSLKAWTPSKVTHRGSLVTRRISSNG